MPQMSRVRWLKVLVQCFIGSRFSFYISVWLSHGCSMASQSEPRSYSKREKERWKPGTWCKKQSFLRSPIRHWLHFIVPSCDSILQRMLGKWALTCFSLYIVKGEEVGRGAESICLIDALPNLIKKKNNIINILSLKYVIKSFKHIQKYR